MLRIFISCFMLCEAYPTEWVPPPCLYLRPNSSARSVVFQLDGLAYLFLLRSIHGVFGSNDSDEASIRPVEANQVEVRAVFINCEPDVRNNVAPDNEASRFEREELFKHSVLRDCGQKLALTVKLASEPDQSVDDEYIPIEHVIEGQDKKRVRLLNPYILWLRREPPQQAYKLRRIDTVKGILSNSDDENINGKVKYQSEFNQRAAVEPSRQEWALNQVQRKKRALSSGGPTSNRSVSAEHVWSRIRSKRSEHNIIVEDAADEVTHKQTLDKELESSVTYGATSHSSNKQNYRIGDATSKSESLRKSDTKTYLISDQTKCKKKHRTTKEKRVINNHNARDQPEINELNENGKPEVDDYTDKTGIAQESRDRKSDYITKFHGNEKEYAVYEIGEPDLWGYVDVQLFEKMSTPEGKTVWNDLTKGKQASVSSLNPEWKGQDVIVQYRTAEWLSRDQYTLPGMSLCLLVPVHSGTSDYPAENATFSDGDYMVIPSEDILAEQDNTDISKRSDNNTDADSTTTSDEQCNRRVIVRTSRALMAGSSERLNLASRGSDRYLTLPHRSSHRAQIDLEARADGNELVRVGASGRISTAVTDSTRATRTVITIQASNTGLAAARFRVIARDCGPELSSVVDEQDRTISVGPVLLPPRHTRNFQFELPIESPIDMLHCSVQLVNDADESVAVRDVAIKKSDRCFCIWHCDCVCLGDDPKLLCREMAEGRQVAAGLSTRDLVRRGRSICYADVVYINLTVVIFGVVLFLLLLGFLKASLGLVFRCIGTFGLSSLLKTPRNLDSYYERSLASRPVVYDENGWPVHPDSKERTVHVVSWPMEFFLNLIYFVAVPCVTIYEAIKKCTQHCKNTDILNRKSFSPTKAEKCFSSHDMQGIRGRPRRRRGELRRWMSPDAQKLSTEIMHKGLTPQLPLDHELMKPLLLEDHLTTKFARDIQDSCPDSEQDDTEYVLMQMQKSKESLAKSKRKLQEPEQSSLKSSRIVQ